MGLLSDAPFAPNTQPTLREPTSLLQEFGKGVRSGITGTHAGLRAFAGTVAELRDEDELAQSHYQRARELQAQAQLEAPEVSSYKQVDDLRSGARYVAGLVGGSMPSMVAGVGAGLAAKTAAGALAAGTLAQTPIEAGDVAMKQMDDPEAMAMSAGERGLRQLGGGLGSAALQSVVPAAISGKLLGRGAEQAAKQSVGQVIGGAAKNIPMEGFFEGAGDALKQTASNETRALDWDSIKENAIGGAAAGGAMGTIGAAADLTYRNGPMARDALSGGLTSIKEKFGESKNKAGVVLEEAGDTAQNFYKDAKTNIGKAAADFGESEYGKKAKDLYERASEKIWEAKDKTSDIMGKIVRGEPVGFDPKEAANKTADQLRQMFDVSDNEKLKAAKKAGEEILSSKFGFNEETKAEIAKHMETIGEEASQIFVATKKQAFDALRNTSKKVGKFAEWAAEKTKGIRKGMEEETDAPNETMGLLAYDPETGEAVPTTAKRATPPSMLEQIDAARSRMGSGQSKYLQEWRVLKKSLQDQGYGESDIREAQNIFNGTKTAAEQSAADANRTSMKRFAEANGIDLNDAVDPFDQPGSKPKKSEDYSGVERVIGETLQRIGLFERRPDLIADNDSINNLAFGLRSLINEMTTGKLDERGIKVATELLGDDTDSIVNSLRGALALELSPEESRNFMTSINRLDEAQRKGRGIRAELSAINIASGREIPSDHIEIFQDHARGKYAARDRGQRDVETEKAADRQVNALYQHHFGDMADKARDIIAKSVKTKDVRFGGEESVGDFDPEAFGEEGVSDGASYDENNNRLEEAPTEMQIFSLSEPDAKGRSKIVRGVEGLKYDPADQERIKKDIKKIQGYFPSTDTGLSHKVFFDPEINRIVAEKLGPAGDFNMDDFDAMTFNDVSADAARVSPSRLMIGGKAFDAIKIGRRMLGKGGELNIKDDLQEGASYKKRLADGFMQGVARLSTQMGSNIDIPDSTVIGYVNEKPFTWKQAQKVRTGEDEKPSGKIETPFGSFPISHEGQNALRGEYMARFMSDARLKAAKINRVRVPADQLEDMKKQGDYALKAMTRAMDDRVAYDQVKDKDVSESERKRHINIVSPVVAEYKGGISVRKNVTSSEANSSSVEFHLGGVLQNVPNNRVGVDQLGKLLAKTTSLPDKTLIRRAIKVITEPAMMKEEMVKQKFLTVDHVNKIREYNEEGGLERSDQWFDKDGNLSERGKEELLEKQGRLEIGKDEQVHLQATFDGKKGMQRSANMDGSGKYQKRGSVPNLSRLVEQSEGWDVTSAGAKKIKTQLDGLLQNINAMSAADQRRLADLAPFVPNEKSVVVYSDRDVANMSLIDHLDSIGTKRLEQEIAGRVARVGKYKADGDLAKTMRSEIAAIRKELERRKVEGFEEKGVTTPASVAPLVKELIGKYSKVLSKKNIQGPASPVKVKGTNGFVIAPTPVKDANGKFKAAPVPDPVKEQQQDRADRERRIYEHELAKEDAKKAVGQAIKLEKGALKRDSLIAVEAAIKAKKKMVEALKKVKETSGAYDGNSGSSGKSSVTATAKPSPNIADTRKANMEIGRKSVEQLFREVFGDGGVYRTIEGELNPKEPPSPKAVAPEKGAAHSGDETKKQASVQLAKSNDPKLLDDIEAATDAKQLQRLINHLADHAPDTQAMKRAIERLKEMIQSDESIGYGLQTKKYSLESTNIHNDLGREGFAATHDSPVRHGGVFNWREHQGKGEGNAAFGAGTYLSTADGVHKSYKGAFTVKTSKESSQDYEQRVAAALAADPRYPKILREIDALDPDGLTFAFGPHTPEMRTAEKELRKIKQDAERAAGRRPITLGASPTYHVSVNIKDEQLMHWDKPLSEQSELVQKALESSIAEIHGKLRQHTALQIKFAKQFTDGTITGGKIYHALSSQLGSQAKASDYLQSLGILGHKYAASGGTDDKHPNYVIYDDSKITTNYVHFSKTATNKNTTVSKSVHSDIADYIQRVLGSSVKLAWGKFSHAGDYTHALGKGIIRLSVHALNPMSTAHHEALHAFIAQMRDAGARDVVDVLYKASSSDLVMDQLKAKYKNQPAVLEQLRKDPEERAAYMYQLWAADPKAFRVSLAAKNVMQRFAKFIRDVLGIWSNDERALHIMEYFHSGEYAQNMGKPNAVHTALMDARTNKAIEYVKELTEPLARLSDALVSTGDARIRDMNVPAFNQIADLVKRRATDEGVGEDNGFIPASRIQTTKRMNDMVDRLGGFTKEHLSDALEALQSQTTAQTPEGRLAAKEVKAILQETRNYMVKAGVQIGNLGPDYFPRVWDTHYISKNEQAFRNMMEPYVRSGDLKGNVTDLIKNLTSRDGVEFNAVTPIPGMQFKKPRILDFLKPEDAAPFLVKDLYGTLGSYIAQASRRAEWDRRFGFDAANQEIRMLKLYAEAEDQGATDEQFKVLEDYIMAVDGTLGDDINPKARRWMGNMMVYQNIRLLPMAVFSMVVDPLGIMVRGGTVGEAFNAFKRGISAIPKSFKKGYTPDEAEKLAELLGVVDNAVLSDTMGDAYTQGMVGGTAKKVNHLFFKYNGVEGMNRAFRVGATEAAMAFIKRHASLTASPHSERWMKELGLEQGDVVIMPNGQLAVSSKQGLNAGQERRIHAAVNMWVDGAIQRPNAAEKPIWMNDPHWSLIAHLKQFVWSFQETILKRVGHEFDKGNYAPAMALTSYVPMMIAVDTAKGILQNGGDVPEWKKDWGAWEYTSYGIERAGLYGVNQFGLDIMSDVERGGVGAGALGGPTIDQLADAVQAVGGNREFAPVVVDSLPANALYKDQF